MKRNLYTSFAIAAMLITLAGCQTKTALLCSPWKVTDVTFNEGTTLNDFQQKKMVYMMKYDYNFAFMPDSNYRVVSMYDTTYGKWWFSKDKKQIVSLINGNESYTDLIKLNKKEFRFKPVEPGNNIKEIKCVPSNP